MIRRKDQNVEAVVYRAENVLLENGLLRVGAVDSLKYASSLVPGNLGLVSLIPSDSPWRTGYPGFADYPEVLHLFSWVEAEVGIEDPNTMLDIYERTAIALDKENQELLVVETSPVGIKAASELGCLVLNSLDYNEINAYIWDHVKKL